MIAQKTIERFEHERLVIGEEGFKAKHLNALLKLNEYHKGKYFEPIAKGIKFSQYVGVIQIDGLTILIHPKSDKDDSSKNWRKVLIQMLKSTGRLKPQSVGDADVKRQHLNLLELYFEMFLNEVTLLIRQGLIKQYRKQTENSLALKGKLEFAGHIRHNLVHKERFYTTHQVYDTDHTLHQILAMALDIVEQFTRGHYLSDHCSRTLMDFPDLKKRTVSFKSIESYSLTRKSEPYRKALDLARLIILNYSPDIHKGQEKMLALLFDMNQLWEEYVLKMLKRYVGEYQTNYEVMGQDSKSFWGSNSLRPDIVISQKGSGQRWIIDTKWKRPTNSLASISDLRQMYAYHRFWRAEKTMLLYPGEDDYGEYSPFYDRDEELITHCKMGFKNVLDREGRLDAGIGESVFGMVIG